MISFPDTLTALYIHWPFCPYRCRFCPFVALASHNQFMPTYHDALTHEVKNFAKKLDYKPDLTSIFLGGGTPSTYPDELLLDMTGILANVFVIDDSEITIEVNPGTVRPGQLSSWERMGINRLSIGVQTLNDIVLQRLNRRHTAHESLSLIKRASDRFDNLSVDLILGLPGVSTREWKETLRRIVSLPIKHLSLYFLTVHETTPLYFDLRKGNVTLPLEDEMIDLYHWSAEFLDQEGLQRYELSNFARPGYESRHNKVYWQRKPYKGFGLGACSFDGTTRTANEKNLSRYIEYMRSNQPATVFEERLTTQQVVMETMMLGLRCKEGVSLKDIAAHLKPDQRKQLRKRVTSLKNKNFIAERRGSIMLTPAGLVLENEIVTQLLR